MSEADTSESKKAMQNLQGAWYNALCSGMNLDDSSFQLVQASNPIGTTSDSIERLFDAVPPKAVANKYNPSQRNSFFDQYRSVISTIKLQSEAGDQFRQVMGDHYDDWQQYKRQHSSQIMSKGIVTAFKQWADINLPASAARQAKTLFVQMHEKTGTIGRLVGACDAAAETNEEMNDAVETAEERTADVDRPAALYPLGGGYVAANDTFIDSIMTVGGTDNVAAGVGSGYPQVSDEVILESNPELILVTDPEAAILDSEPYASTTAGAEDSYVVMNVNYLNQPAPRSVIESTTTLSNAVVELQGESSESTDGAEGGSSDGDGSGDGDSSGDGNSSGDGDTSDGDTSDGGSTTDGSDGSGDGGSAGDTGAESPGFGVVAAALALLATGLLARRE